MISTKTQIQGYDSFAPEERHVGLPKHNMFSNYSMLSELAQEPSLAAPARGYT